MNHYLTLEWLGSLALRGSALLSILLFVAFAARRFSAARRSALWMSGMVGLIALPTVMLGMPAWRILPNHEISQLSTSTEPLESMPLAMHVAHPSEQSWPPPVPVATSMTDTMQSQPRSSRNRTSPVDWLPGIWLTGLLAGMASLAISALVLWWKRRAGSPLDIPEAKALAAKVGITWVPDIRAGPVGTMPMVWGIWRPVLLLPEDFKLWPTEDRQAVLLHELAHLARRDPLLIWIGQIARLIHWFNPLSWLAFHWMRWDQERACDDAVLRGGIRPSSYARMLLNASLHSPQRLRVLQLRLAFARRASINTRILAVLDTATSRHVASPLGQTVWFAAILSLVMPLALVAQRDAVSETPSEPRRPTLKTFCDTPTPAPQRFSAKLTRAHYFADDVPNRDDKDCITLSQGVNEMIGSAFVIKGSPIQKSLRDWLSWEGSVTGEVTLQWRDLGTKPWLEIIELPDAPSTKGPESRPTEPDSTSGNTDSARQWDTVEHNDLAYVSLEQVAASHDWTPPPLRAGSSQILIDRAIHRLSRPIVELDGKMYLSDQDVRRVVEPALEARTRNTFPKFTTVVIDPGHGGNDLGGMGPFESEKQVTLEVGFCLRKALKKRGIQVVMTRESDVFVSLARRAAIANAIPDSVFVSLHCNSGNPNTSGVETFVMATPVGKAAPDFLVQKMILAHAVHPATVDTTQFKDRGIASARWQVATEYVHPSVLLEMGFLTNKDEAAWLATPENRQKLADGIAESLAKLSQQSQR